MNRTGNSWIECAVLTILGPLFGWWVAPEDPMFLGTSIQWLALVPLLLALQHGLLPGLVSAATLGAMTQFWDIKSGTGLDLVGPLFWMSVPPLLAGLFRDSWKTKRETTQRSTAELVAEHERLRLGYQLLRHSHGELEARLAGSPPAVLHAAEQARTRILAAAPHRRPELLLELLAQQTGVECASLWRAGRPGEPARLLATLGSTDGADPGTPGHPLMRRALATGRLCTLAQPGAESAGGSILAAIPAGTPPTGGRWVVAVHQLPLERFEPRNLQRAHALLEQVTHAPAVLGEAEAAMPARSAERADITRTRVIDPSRTAQRGDGTGAIMSPPIPPAPPPQPAARATTPPAPLGHVALAHARRREQGSSPDLPPLPQAS